MKYLVVLIIVLLGVTLWRSRQRPRNARPGKPPMLDAPQDMVSCRLCSLHIPGSEAVQGQLGLYCCNDHRHRAEN